MSESDMISIDHPQTHSHEQNLHFEGGRGGGGRGGRGVGRGHDGRGGHHGHGHGRHSAGDENHFALPPLPFQHLAHGRGEGGVVHYPLPPFAHPRHTHLPDHPFVRHIPLPPPHVGPSVAQAHAQALRGIEHARRGLAHAHARLRLPRASHSLTPAAAHITAHLQAHLLNTLFPGSPPPPGGRRRTLTDPGPTRPRPEREAIDLMTLVRAVEAMRAGVDERRRAHGLHHHRHQQHHHQHHHPHVGRGRGRRVPGTRVQREEVEELGERFGEVRIEEIEDSQEQGEQGLVEGEGDESLGVLQRSFEGMEL